MPHDASASVFEAMIEDGLNSHPVETSGPLTHTRSKSVSAGAGPDPDDPGPQELSESGVGGVNVTTNGLVDDAGGRCWNVTFSTAVDAVGPLTAASTRLTGSGAAVRLGTLEAGNVISGAFALRFLGQKTPPIAWNASASAIEEALLEIPGVAFARATRTNPVADCLDGLCREGGEGGRTPGGGLQWTVELTTRIGSAEPSFPTVAVEAARGGGGDGALREGEFEWPEVVSFLRGSGATAALERGWSRSVDRSAAALNASQPFSISLGGVGASHGEARDPIGSDKN